MKYRYIAIEREYGSGGTTIARRLAEECGIACYGQEILEAVAKEQNVSVDEIQRCEETVSNSFYIRSMQSVRCSPATLMFFRVKENSLLPSRSLYVNQHIMDRQYISDTVQRRH